MDAAKQAIYEERYRHAVREEARLREEAYLETPYFVCGVEISQITPRILTRLFAMETPFLGGSGVSASEAEIGRFLWACSPEFTLDKGARHVFLQSIISIDWTQAYVEINEFVRVTFMDAPRGHKASIAYVSGVAWLEYMFLQKPFCWDWNTKTADTPVRRLYQLLRCDALTNGATVLVNPLSDAIKQEWVNEESAEAKPWTPQMIAANIAAAQARLDARAKAASGL